MNMTTDQANQPEKIYRGLLISLLFNIGIPLLLYYLMKSYLHASEVTALSVACIFPVVNNII
jgi:hypothetical protein